MIIPPIRNIIAELAGMISSTCPSSAATPTGQPLDQQLQLYGNDLLVISVSLVRFCTVIHFVILIWGEGRG